MTRPRSLRSYGLTLPSVRRSFGGMRLWRFLWKAFKTGWGIGSIALDALGAYSLIQQNHIAGSLCLGVGLLLLVIGGVKVYREELLKPESGPKPGTGFDIAGDRNITSDNKSIGYQTGFKIRGKNNKTRGNTAE